MTAGLFKSTGFTAYSKNPLYTVGKKIRSVDSRFALTSGTSNNGDQLVLAGGLTFGDKILGIISSSPAFTSANDNDLGFFKKNADGTFTALKDSSGNSAKDILWNGVDLSSALSYRELLRTLNTSLDTTKNIGQILGLGADAEPVGGVYLILTMNTANSAAAPVVNFEIKVEEATTN